MSADLLDDAIESVRDADSDCDKVAHLLRWVDRAMQEQRERADEIELVAVKLCRGCSRCERAGELIRDRCASWQDGDR